MRDASGLSPTVPTSRERSRLALYRIADSLGCRPEIIKEAAGSESFPDSTAEVVRLWFKLQNDEARRTLLEQGRALVTRKRG